MLVSLPLEMGHYCKKNCVRETLQVADGTIYSTPRVWNIFKLYFGMGNYLNVIMIKEAHGAKDLFLTCFAFCTWCHLAAFADS